MTCACVSVDGGSPQGARARAPRPRQELRKSERQIFCGIFFRGCGIGQIFRFVGAPIDVRARRCPRPGRWSRSRGGIRRSARYGRHVVLTLVFGRGCRRYRLPRSGIALLRTAAFGVLQYVAHSVIRRWRFSNKIAATIRNLDLVPTDGAAAMCPWGGGNGGLDAGLTALAPT
jgi:hypothetical protein